MALEIRCVKTETLRPGAGLSAGFECAHDLDVSRISRENDESRGGEFRANRNHGVHAIHFRHLQIHQNGVKRNSESKLC